MNIPLSSFCVNLLVIIFVAFLVTMFYNVPKEVTL